MKKLGVILSLFLLLLAVSAPAAQKKTSKPVRPVCAEKYRDFRRALIEMEGFLRGTPPSGYRALLVYRHDFQAVRGKLQTEQTMAFGSLDVEAIHDKRFNAITLPLYHFDSDLDSAISEAGSRMVWDPEAYGRFLSRLGPVRDAFAAMTGCAAR